MKSRVCGILLCLVLVISSIPAEVFAAVDNGSESTIGIRDTDFLKTDGKLIRKNYGTGEITYLRGTNAGGYLLQEFWMCLTDSTENVKCELDIYNKLTERFGSQTMYELINFYQDAYWTEADFDNCAALGMNCIRLPIWYRNLVDENGNLLWNAWNRIDWFLQEAGERGIYVILDMHGAPGSQNGSDHSGVDGGDNKQGASQFFWGENAAKNQELYYSLWEQMAARYKDNPVVAGYDLLNEPYCTYRYNSSYSDEELHALLWGIYDTVYDKIRAIDQNHIIIMEATWDAWDLPNPADYGWSNVMYEYHNYLYDDYNNAEGRQITNMQTKLDGIAAMNCNVPSYMGEFSYFDNPNAWEIGLQLFNDAGLNWTSWTYKTTSNYGNWGLFHHTSDNRVNIEYDSIDTIKSKWANVATSSENTNLTSVMKKYLPGVNKTTQYVTPADGEYYFTVNNKVVQAPNAGNSPLAAVSDAYTGDAEKFIVVNNADGTFSLKSAVNGKYVCAVIDDYNQLIARSDVIDAWEKFYAVRVNDSQIGLLSYANGKFVKGDFNEGQGNGLKAENANIGGAWEAFTIKALNGEKVDLSGDRNNYAGTSEEGNMLGNPLFVNRMEGWSKYVDSSASANFSQNVNAGLDIDIKNVGDLPWSVQLYQDHLNLLAGKKYEVKIDLVSTSARNVVLALQDFHVEENVATDYKSETIALAANERKTVTFTTDTLTSDTVNGKLYIGLGKVLDGGAASKVTIYSVNVVPMEGERPEPEEIKVTEIIPSERSISLKEGEIHKISVNITPDTATNKTVSFGSDNAEVATVTEDGTIAAVKAGSAIITITANDGSGVIAEVPVNVEAEVIPDEGSGTTPDEGSGTTPDEGSGTTPDEGSGTNPDEGDGTIPDEGSGTIPDKGSGTTPNEGSGTTPDEETGTIPDEGNETPSDEGSGTTPDEGSGMTPDEEIGTTPDEETVTTPDEESVTPPDEGSGTIPDEGNEGETTGVGTGNENQGGVTPDVGLGNEIKLTPETSSGNGSENMSTPDAYKGNESGNTPVPDTGAGTETTLEVEKGVNFNSAKFKYKITGAIAGAYTVEITAPIKKNMKTIAIPATVEYKEITFKVTSIKKNAFKNNKKLKKVTIGKNVTKIGANAFAGCKKLKTIKISSKNLKTVGKNAFRSIDKKAVIKVPSGKVKAYKKLLEKAKIASTINVKK